MDLLTRWYGRKIINLYNNTKNLTLKELIKKVVEENIDDVYKVYQILGKKVFEEFLNFCKENNSDMYLKITKHKAYQDIKRVMIGKIFNSSKSKNINEENYPIYEAYNHWVETGKL